MSLQNSCRIRLLSRAVCPYIFAPIYLPLFIGAKYSSICPYVFIGVKCSLITGSVPTLKASRYTMLLTLLALKDCYRPCDCGARGRGGRGRRSEVAPCDVSIHLRDAQVVVLDQHTSPPTFPPAPPTNPHPYARPRAPPSATPAV